MAGETLESTFVINDKASDVLEQIQAQADQAAKALADLNNAMATVETAGDATRGAYSGKSSTHGDKAPDVASAADGIAAAVEATNAATAQAVQAAEAAQAEAQELEKLADAARPEALCQEFTDAKKEFSDFAEEFRDASQDMKETSKHALDDAEKEVRYSGRMLKEDVKGLGADLHGWIEIIGRIGDVFRTLGDAVEKLAEESDKLNTRMARYGLVADAEGKTGSARGERGEEIYKRHQNFAQALGLQSEAFNETVLNMYSNGEGVVKSIEQAQQIAASSYMAMDIAGLRGSDKDAVMGEVQSMISVGIADADQIEESMKIAPNILRTIERQWTKNLNGKAFKLDDGTEITDGNSKIAVLAQQGLITAELVAQAMTNSAQETKERWETLPSTWEKLENRLRVIVENMTKNIVKKFGELADDNEVANFVMEGLKLGEKLVAFCEEKIVPVIGGALRAIGSILTTLLDVLNDWWSAIPIIAAVGVALTTAAIKAGILKTALLGVKVALAALASNPFTAILVAVAAATLAIAHFVRTTEAGQQIMLYGTAAVCNAFLQIGEVIAAIGDFCALVWDGIKYSFYNVIQWVLNKLEGALESLAEFSDTAKDALESVRESRKGAQESLDEIAAKGGSFGAVFDDMEKRMAANTKALEDYNESVPEIARKALERNKSDLKLSGFLDDALNLMEEMPGVDEAHPAHVKGKVALDGEYFDILKKAAGAEIVNRYTNMRPTVNASFGDINQLNARDVLRDLVEEMERAKGAALSQAQGAA